MKGFEINAVSMFEPGQPGPCPFCAGIHVNVLETASQTRYSISFDCPDCKKSDHFDGFLPKGDSWAEKAFLQRLLKKGILSIS